MLTLPSLTQVRVYPPAQAEHVRYPTWGDAALRGAETRPVTSDTLGVRVVGVLGSLVVAVTAQGVAPSGRASPSTRCAHPGAARRSTCC